MSGVDWQFLKETALVGLWKMEFQGFWARMEVWEVRYSRHNLKVEGVEVVGDLIIGCNWEWNQGYCPEILAITTARVELGFWLGHVVGVGIALYVDFWVY